LASAPNPFLLLDAARRQIGSVADAWGLGPREAGWRQAASFRGARLRAYQPAGSEGPVLLIVPAPFKRAYIWDLVPEVSVVRAALTRRFGVYLLEWLPPTPAENDLGLADYALHLVQQSVKVIQAETGAVRAHLAGHSLGGTFAAIFACLRPASVGRLLLIDAPLAFGEDGGALAAAVARAPRAERLVELLGQPMAGSLVNVMSGAALPEAFVLQRRVDLLASFAAPAMLAHHARVARWTLDEFPLPARLFVDVAEALYRDDQLRRGCLDLGTETAALARLTAPVLAVVNPAGRVVPPSSILAGLAVAAGPPPVVYHYAPEPAVVLQHLGPLVGPSAHRELWPRILEWLQQPSDA
jgi:polyhydroxyalkanoate synthase subunit PhaC